MDIKVDRHIIIIGFMAVGKSTVGKVLADRVGLPFYDTDEMIVEQEDKSITEIFRESGETYFRILERQALQSILGSHPAVISAGGGLPCYNKNMELIIQNAIGVHIQLGVQKIVDRLSADSTRPLVSGLSKSQLRNMVTGKLRDRKVHYNKAQIQVRGIGSASEITDRIISKIRIQES